MKPRLAIALQLSVFGIAASAAPPTMTVSVTPRDCELGQHIQVEAVILAEEGIHLGEILTGALEESVSLVGEIEVLPEETLSDGRVQTIARLTFAPSDTGTLALPAIIAQWTNEAGEPDLLRAELGELEVRGSIVGGTPENPLEAHGPFAMAESLPLWPWIAGGVALVMLIGGWLWARLRRPRAPERTSPRAHDGRPPHEIALEDLAALERSSLVRDGKCQTFFYTLTDIVRVYIEDEVGIAAVEMTSREIVDALQHAVYPASLCDKVRRWVAACDLVKYASQHPRDEHCTTAITLARAIVTDMHQHWLSLQEGEAARTHDSTSARAHEQEAA